MLKYAWNVFNFSLKLCESEFKKQEGIIDWSTGYISFG